MSDSTEKTNREDLNSLSEVFLSENTIEKYFKDLLKHTCNLQTYNDEK